MTVIVGVAREKTVVLGADSLTLFGSERAIRTVPKIFRLGPLLVGVAGSPRVSDVLRYAWLSGKPTVHDQETQSLAHDELVTLFVPWLRETAKTHGLLAVADGQDLLMGHSILLIGCRAGVFTVSPDFSVTTYADGYTAIGSAAEYALGAMHTVDGAAAREMVNAGLAAAAWFSVDVAPPYAYLTLEDAP